MVVVYSTDLILKRREGIRAPLISLLVGLTLRFAIERRCQMVAGPGEKQRREAACEKAWEAGRDALIEAELA